MLTVVMGPPCGGKTTYVRAQRAPDDVVLDVDALAVAVGAEAGAPHHAGGYQRAAALSARRALTAWALGHATTPDMRVWLIHHHPDAATIARYDRAGAELVVCDPGQAECERRTTGRPRSTADAIAHWYAAPPQIPASTAPSGRRW